MTFVLQILMITSHTQFCENSLYGLGDETCIWTKDHDRQTLLCYVRTLNNQGTVGLRIILRFL